MKNIFTLCTALFLVGTINAQQVTFCDDFEGYLIGDPIALTSPIWETWGSIMTPCPTTPCADDAFVSNINSSSGMNSLYLNGGTAGGPSDIILPFGSGIPYITGDFELITDLFVTSSAYLNIQAEPYVTNASLGTVGIWSLNITMDSTGTIIIDGGTNAVVFITSTYPLNQWFEFKIDINLTQNIWEVYIDNLLLGSFSNTSNKISSLNLYPTIGNDYYVDDICYTYTPAQLDTLNAQISNITAITGLAGQTRNPSVEVRNLGINNITSFDVDFDYNGTIITENITGVNLTTTDVYQVNFINTISLLGGTNPGIATVYNVNGLGQDDNPNDDSMTTQIEAIIPAPGKLVIGEEATGTWCGWCPRGAVALNWMDKDYEGYWQGIAVHNGDPMTDVVYDLGLGSYISGYPSGIVDRGTDIDPSNFKQDFLQRIVIAPNGIITNGAELNGNILKVSLTVDIQNTINGNYKLACVLVEDSVTGTGTQYYQSNSYSGGNSLIDVDGTDWNVKPSSVPDWQMIYRHVARGISPSFTGEPLSTTSYISGDTETICYEFTLDPSWDQSQIHIIGMLLDNYNRIDNASSSTINNAVAIGYSACPITSTGIELNGPDRVNIYPNPATDNIYISNLKEDNTLVKIYDINGSLVLENKVSNKEYLNISNLSKGMYQLKFEGSDWKETRKLIKE